MRLATPWALVALLVAFASTAGAQTTTHSNMTPILIPGTGTAAGPGAPYPSEIVTSGLPGVIQRVTVTLNNLSHTWPNDVDVLLVAPSGSTVLLLSDAIGGSGGITNRTYTFDDDGAVMPSAGFPPSGIYRPTNYDTTSDNFPAPAPTAPFGSTLSSLIGQTPNGTWSLYVQDDTNLDVGQMAGGWSLTITTAASVPPASLAAFSTTLGGANFATAGACSLPGVRRIATIGMQNFGTGGTVNVLSATITGSSAFSIETISPVPPTFPVALAANATAVNIGVAFSPTTGQTGPQNATLVLTYNLDGGPSMTREIPVTGTADAEGAGFQFRSSVVAAACAPDAGTPGTAFINPVAAGHTRVTTLTAGDLNDGRLRLPLSTIPSAPWTSYRLFGIDHPILEITTNLVVGFVPTGSATTVAANNYGGAGVNGLATLNVAAMNTTFLASAVGTDNQGVAGAPGVFYGFSDVDGDGRQELVITYWHAHDVGSVPGPNAEYFTAQLILFKAARPNQEDYFEIRFPSGNDANGVPYRQNTTTTVGGDNSIENDTHTALFEHTLTEAAIYRLRNGTQNAAATVVFGGPMYDGSGSLGVRFQAERQATAQGVAGWRMLGVPVRNYTVGRLAGVNLVQGVTNQYPAAGVNLYTRYDGGAWLPATSTAQQLVPGEGFLWYLYDLECDPTLANGPACIPGSPPATDGTSRSYTLPMPLEGTGAEPALDGRGGALTPLHSGGNGWNLAANPWRDAINVSNIASWANGGTLLSSVGQVWDPNTQSYVLTSTLGNLVSAWQGFMIQNNTGTAGATGLSIPNPKTTGATFVGRTAEPRHVAFELSGTRADGTGETLDRSAVLFFAEGAADGWDLLDAGKLEPLVDRYATLAFVGERDGATVLKAQESRPLDVTTFEVPLAVTAVGTAPTLTLSWPALQNVPSSWSFQLRDLVTGAVVDLRTATSYTFDMTVAAPRATADGMPVLGDAVAALADARFVLEVSSSAVSTEGGAVPTAFSLHRLSPNPVAGPSALVRFDLPQASDVTVEVFDLLGRRVSVLAEGTHTAGTHTIRLDSSAMPAGVYVVRMRAGTFAAMQQVTVVR